MSLVITCGTADHRAEPEIIYARIRIFIKLSGTPDDHGNFKCAPIRPPTKFDWQRIPRYLAIISAPSAPADGSLTDVRTLAAKMASQ